MGIGTTAPSYQLELTGSLGVGTTATIATVSLSGAFLDKDGDVGSNGQILSTTGSATDWIAATTDTDKYVGIDAAATPGYLGAAYNDGVLRADTTGLDYTDGGDFITLAHKDTSSQGTSE